MTSFIRNDVVQEDGNCKYKGREAQTVDTGGVCRLDYFFKSEMKDFVGQPKQNFQYFLFTWL